MSKSENPAVARLQTDAASIETLKNKVTERRNTAQTELEDLITRVGVDVRNGIPTTEDVSKELKGIYKELDDTLIAGRDPAQLLQRLVKTQDKLNVALKADQVGYLDNVVDSCSQIGENVKSNRLFDIPQHVESLQQNLDALEKMPSIGKFEAQNAEFARLSSLLDPKLIDPSLTKSAAYQQSVGAIYKAFKASAAPFLGEKAEEVPANLREVVTQNAEEVLKGSRDKKSDDIKKQAPAQENIEMKIKAAQAELQKLQQPEKPSIKGFFSKLLNPKGANAKNESKQTEIKNLSNKIKSWGSELAEHKKVVSALQSEVGTADMMLENLSDFRSAEPEIARPDLPIADLALEGKNSAKGVMQNESVRFAVEVVKQETQTHDNKVSHLESSIQDAFKEAFLIAKLVREGKVKMNADASDMAISGLKMAVEYAVPVPIAKEGAIALLDIAKFAHGQQRLANNSTVADIGQDPDVRKMVEEFSKTISASYSHQTKGESPLDRLSEKGIEKFAQTLVAQTISALGNKSVTMESLAENPNGPAIALASTMVRGEEKGTFSKQISEIGTKVRFDAADMADNKAAGWTYSGLTKRAPIVGQSSNVYASTDREETALGQEGKYLPRLALPGEENDLTSGKAAGYTAFKPAAEILREKRGKLLDSVTAKDFKTPQQFAKKEELLDNLVAGYAKLKLEGKSTNELNDYLKKGANSFMKEGSSFGIGMIRSRDDSRQRFNDIKKMIVEVGEANVQAKIAEAPRAAAKSNRLAGMSQQIMDASITATTLGNALVQATGGDLSHIREGATTILQNSGQVVQSAAKAASNLSLSDISTGLISGAEQIQEMRNNFEQMRETAKTPAIKREQIPAMFDVVQKTGNLIDRAQAAKMGGFTKTSGHKDNLEGYENVMKDADPKHFMRVKRGDDGQVVDVKLFAASTFGKAKEIPLFDGNSPEIRPEAATILQKLTNTFEKEVARGEALHQANDVLNTFRRMPRQLPKAVESQQGLNDAMGNLRTPQQARESEVSRTQSPTNIDAVVQENFAEIGRAKGAVQNSAAKESRDGPTNTFSQDVLKRRAVSQQSENDGR